MDPKHHLAENVSFGQTLMSFVSPRQGKRLRDRELELRRFHRSIEALEFAHAGNRVIGNEFDPPSFRRLGLDPIRVGETSAASHENSRGIASPSANALDVNRNGPPVAADALAVEPGLDGVAVIGLTSIVTSGGAEAVAVAGAGTDWPPKPAPGCPPVVQAASPTVMARAAAGKAKRMAIVGQDAPSDESRQMRIVPGQDRNAARNSGLPVGEPRQPIASSSAGVPSAALERSKPAEWAGTSGRAIIVAAT